MLIDQVKRAKQLKEQGVTVSDMEDDVGIARAYIPKLIDLYDQMSNVQVLDDKNSEYVRIKKKRYIIKSLKLQHKMHDIRQMYIKNLEVLTNKRKKLREYLDRAEQIQDLKNELDQKQKMLDVTSSNLQHAEDGYEYLKKDTYFNKILFFTYGMVFLMFVIVILGNSVMQINVSF